MVNNVSGFIGPETLYSGLEVIRADLEDLFMGKLHGLPMGIAPCYTNHMKSDQNQQELGTMLCAMAGANYFMGVPGGDDVMLSYMDTSYYDDASVREILGLRPLPEFEQWLEKMGIMENGRLTKIAEIPPFLIGNKEVTIVATKGKLIVENGVVTLPPADMVLIEDPINPEAVEAMKKSTPARICYGRAGARARTVAWLRFLADHAMAMDTVFTDVSEEFLKRMDLMTVQTMCRDKQEFLKRMDLGRKLSEEAKKTILEKCDKNKQVQILVVDGLSSNAIEANIPDLLPALIQGLEVEGITYGKPFFIKYGRVWAQDEVARLVNCDIVISLIVNGRAW